MTSQRYAFIFFHLTLATIVFVESVMTVFHALHYPADSHLGMILPWFAGLEAIAAVLFAIPKTLKIGGWMLLVIFAFAIITHGPLHQMPLFVFAAGVIFVMVHGAAYSAEIRSESNETNSGENTR